MPNQFHEYNDEEFNSLPWANDFLNADPHSAEFSNAMAEADKYYGPEWTNKQLEDWGIQFENVVEDGNITPEQLPENSTIQKEAEQLTDNNPNNDEVKNDAVEDFLKQMEAGQPPKKDVDSVSETLRSNYAKDLASNQAWNEARDAGIRGKSSGREEELQEEMLNDDSFQPDLSDINRLAKAANGLDQTPEDNEQLKQALGESYDDVIEKIEANEDKADANLLASEWLKAQGFSTAKSQNKLVNKIGKFLLKEGKFPEVYAGSLENMSARDKNKLLKQGYMAEGRPANRKYGLKSLDEYTKADLENRLKKLRDKSSLENFIEKHPEEAAATLPEGQLKEEAVQAIDGGRDAEVNNKAFDGVDWDKVKVYGPGDNAPDLVSGYRYNEEGKLVDEFGREPKDFERNEFEESTESKDEDFLGPDEYIDENGNIQVDPNWKPENADEDFVGPDEQLMPLGNRDLLPPDNYNHDFDYNIEELDRQPGTPEDAEFESKIVDVNDMGLLRAKPTDFGGSSVGSVSQAPLAQAERHTGGNAIGTKGILPAAALHFSPSSVAGGSTPSSKQFNGVGKVGSIGKSLNPLNADASVVQGKQSESSGFVTNNGGNISSGATNFRSSLGHINPAQLPSEVEEHTAPEYESLLETENLKDALINRINMMLDEIDPRTLKQLGFSPVNHYYKGNSLTKLDGATLNMLSEMLEDYTK